MCLFPNTRDLCCDHGLVRTKPRSFPWLGLFLKWRDLVVRDSQHHCMTGFFCASTHQLEITGTGVGIWSVMVDAWVTRPPVTNDFIALYCEQFLDRVDLDMLTLCLNCLITLIFLAIDIRYSSATPLFYCVLNSYLRHSCLAADTRFPTGFLTELDPWLSATSRCLWSWPQYRLEWLVWSYCT